MNSLTKSFMMLLLPATAVLAQEISVSVQRTYPPAKTVDVSDTFFGKTVRDPYRWMETDSSDLTDWIDAENKITRYHLDRLPQREWFKQRLTEVADYPTYSLPQIKAGKLFYSHNTGLQNQSVLYVADNFTGNINILNNARLLLDPNKLSEDGTVALQKTAVSKDGKYLAYSIARSGSDWNEIDVLNIETGKKLTDHIEWVKFSPIAWFGDGFFYSAYDAPPKDKILTQKNENHKIFYHQLGTPQKDDVLIREDKQNPMRTREASTDREEKFLFVSESESTYGNSLYFRDLSKPENPLRCIADDFKSSTGIVTVIADQFYALTDRDAPMHKLVLIDPENPEPKYWKDIIPESDLMLQGVQNIGGNLVVTYLKDAAHEVYVFDTAGRKIREIKLPALGVAGFSGQETSGRPDKNADDIFYSFTSFLYPSVIYHGNIKNNTKQEVFPAGIKFDTAAYTTDRVFYTNSAGKKVPVFLTYKKGLCKDGNNPVLLYGYGGFNISLTPNFNPFRLPFLEKGGIYAYCVLRGGGEYGEDWHKSGTKQQKQNVFDDFAAAAEFLIKEKYTSPQKLAINGGSNGGLLVGASLTQRPDLFKAAVAQVGVLDMLRYHRFTIGWSWAADYGTSEDSEAMFTYLLGYSPLHHCRAGVNYPATLVMTSDHDDRVVPAHSFKFTAAMQAVSTSENPFYIRVETKAGHGAGKPMSKRIDEQADIWAFVCGQLGID